MRCTLIINSLTSGGAERVISMMANYWAAKGWEINLLTFDGGTEPPFYDLDSQISHIPLGIAGYSPNPIMGIWNNLTRIQKLRTAIIDSKPNVVISFMHQTNEIVLLATRGLNLPVIVSERNDPAMQTIGKVWTKLRQWTYPFADRIVVQTKRAGIYFSGKLQERIIVIPNPVLLPPNEKKPANRLLGEKKLIAIGRLEPQKGFDLLLEAMSKLKNSYAEWTLTILGEGEWRSHLESLRDELGLGDRVHLVGRVTNPHEFLKQADIFIMSSRFEGFPNALCEAMACGLAVISTDCPNGPREIIRDAVDGILVPNEDVSALATAIERLMSDEKKCRSLGDRAKEVTDRFGLEKVMLSWESLITEMIEEK
jgi:GalNAc-alpha-(1->4)-GalNAc-alpha-(1->3)-diNAcBac-PP-undecaprenol alpha-1,4-N-acetyl-D-galactosaminyltransferase